MKKAWTPIFEGKICRIPLMNSDQFALIDSEDYEKIKGKNWIIKYPGGYVKENNPKYQSLSRLILNVTDKNEIVDHIFHDKLDNRKSELRICTKSQNCINSLSGKRKNNTGVRGIHRLKSNGKFHTKLVVDKKLFYLGQFPTMEEAVKVRNEAEEKYFGEYKLRNKEVPDGVTCDKSQP